jgi:hypothetical protein
MSDKQRTYLREAKGGRERRRKKIEINDDY